MRLIYLLGGIGSRLSTISEGRPKSLIPIKGETLFARNTSVFKNFDIPIILATGYKAHLFENLGYESTYNADFSSTNMVWNLLHAIRTKHIRDEILVCYGDIGLAPEAVERVLECSGNDVVVAYDSLWLRYWQLRFDNAVEDAESFLIDRNSNIIEIGGPISSLDEPEGQFVGFLKFSREVVQHLHELPERLEQSVLERMYTTDLLMLLINDGFNLYGVDICGGWVEIDIPEDIEAATRSGRLDEIDDSLDRMQKSQSTM